MRDVVRYGFLVRSEELTPEQFHDHWENSHGPLAMSLAGFRANTVRYVQNHCLPGARVDGIVATYQRERDDYSRGFYHEPDYPVIQVDEQYLMDLSRTVSMLGEFSELVPGDRTEHKAIVLLPAGEAVADHGAVKVTAVALHRDTASALGFGPAQFEWQTLVELWFDTAEQRDRAQAAHESDHPSDTFFAVREIVVL